MYLQGKEITNTYKLDLNSQALSPHFNCSFFSPEQSSEENFENLCLKVSFGFINGWSQT